MNKKPVASLLVQVYELGIRLRQAQLLIESNRHATPSYAHGVLQALTLLQRTFEQLVAVKDLASWKGKVEINLEKANLEWEQHLLCGEYAEAVADRVRDLTLIAETGARTLEAKNPGATDWLQLGFAVVDACNGDSAAHRPSWLNELLDSVQMDREQLIPSVESYDFQDNCPTLSGDFRPWHAVEVGLAKLKESVRGDSASAVTSNPVDGWHQDKEAEPPAPYLHGPLAGTLKDLGLALHPFRNKGDRRTVQQEAGKKSIWVRKLAGQHYEIYFKTESRFEKASEKLDSLQKEHENDVKET